MDDKETYKRLSKDYDKIDSAYRALERIGLDQPDVLHASKILAVAQHRVESALRVARRKMVKSIKFKGAKL